MTFPLYEAKIPSLTTSQMVEVDRAMIEDFHIELIQMMENAGRNLAHLARLRFLDGTPVGKHIAVLAGTGGNGGGALVCAHRLHNWGARVTVVTTKPTEVFQGVSAHQLNILQRMNVLITDAGNATIDAIDLIIDGMIGYSLSGAPHGKAARLIQWANSQETPILALDTPSGLDTTTGKIFDPAIQAAATMTLVLPKEGLINPQVTSNVGELYLADISVPPSIYAQPTLKLEVGPVFAKNEIIRLR